VLSHDRTGGTVAAEAASAVMAAAVRGFERVVVDLPRRYDDVAAVVAERVDVSLLLVPATVRATAAAAGVVRRLAASGLRPELIVRDCSSDLTGDDVATALGLPLRDTLRSDPSVTEAAERGESPISRSRGPLAELCRRLLAAVDVLETAA